MRPYLLYGLWGALSLMMVGLLGCSKKPYQPPEKPEIEIPKASPLAAAEPIPEDVKPAEATLPPLTYLHPVQWHPDFQGDVNLAVQHVLSEEVSFPEGYEWDKSVLPIVIGFFQDDIPGVGTQATVMNINAMASLQDFFKIREYKKTLEVPNGCEVLKASGVAPPLVEQALTGCLGERYTIAEFPFDEPVFDGSNVFGAAGAVPDKDGQPRSLQTASYLQLQTVQGAINLSLDSMLGDQQKGMAFSGVLVFESVPPDAIRNLNEIIDSHLNELSLPEKKKSETVNAVACRNAIKAHPNFVTGYLHHVQFLVQPPVKAYPPFSPAACGGNDWVTIGRNMLINGCATPWENCQGPPGTSKFTGEALNVKYNPHIGQCNRESETVDGKTIRGVNFEFVDESKSKQQAFIVVGMMVKEDQTWYIGELDEWAIPECGLEPTETLEPVDQTQVDV